MRHPLLPVAILMALVILLAELLTGAISFLDNPARSKNHYSHFVESENWMLVRLTSIPSEKKRSVSVVGEVMEIADSDRVARPCKGKIQLYIQKDSTAGQLHYGDQLLLLSTPEQPASPTVPHQFDYKTHLLRKGILYTDYVTSARYRIVGHDTHGLLPFVLTLREKLIQIIRLSSLPPTQQGIAEAIFLGWDGDLSETTEEHFRKAGVTHLLCVSGLHVGLVALMVGALLFFLPNNRKGRIVKALLQVIVVLFFTMLSGMAPGTCRAALMFVIIILGRLFFGKPSTLNSIAASAIILMVVKPSILFDVGFQLSYSAVIGIVVLVPVLSAPIRRLLPEKGSIVQRLSCRLLFRLWQLVCVSLVAQLATSPFCLFYFHKFPTWFLISNIFLVPLASLMIGGTILMLAFSWWPIAFKTIGALLSLLLSFADRLTTFVASLPFSNIDGIYFDEWMLAGFLLMIAIVEGAVILSGKKKNNTRLFGFSHVRIGLYAILVIAILMLVRMRMVEYKCRNQFCAEMYNIEHTTAIEFFFGKTSYLVCDSATAATPERIGFYTDGNLLNRMASREHVLCYDTLFVDDNLLVVDGFVDFGGHTMRIIDRRIAREHSLYKPYVNYIYLSGNPYITIAELKQQYRFDTLMIGSNNGRRMKEKWIKECDEIGVPVVSPK